MKKTWKIISRYLLLIMASLIYALGVSLFFNPNDIAPGGVTGIAILLNRFIPVATGTLILLINIPILLYGIIKLGFRLIASTVFVLLFISFFTNLFEMLFPVLTNDRLIASLAGGGLVAVGIGICFRQHATTGGIDIIVKVLRKKHRHMKTGTIFLSIDFVIVCLAGIVFGTIDAAGYALIAVFISTTVMDFILYGSDEARMLFVISKNAGPITERILCELNIGATFLEGEGAFSHNRKNIILCVMRKQITPKAINIIKSEDPNAFLIITSANEIFGEGYKYLNSENDL